MMFDLALAENTHSSDSVMMVMPSHGGDSNSVLSLTCQHQSLTWLTYSSLIRLNDLCVKTGAWCILDISFGLKSVSNF